MEDKLNAILWYTRTFLQNNLDRRAKKKKASYDSNKTWEEQLYGPVSCSASHPSLIDVWVSLWLLLIQRNQEKSEVMVNQKKKIVDKARVISTYKIQTIESWDVSRHFRWLKWELPIFTLWSEVTQWASYRIHFKKNHPTYYWGRHSGEMHSTGW